jgi:hypothetical protein
VATTPTTLLLEEFIEGASTISTNTIEDFLALYTAPCSPVSSSDVERVDKEMVDVYMEDLDPNGEVKELMGNLLLSA